MEIENNTISSCSFNEIIIDEESSSIKEIQQNLISRKKVKAKQKNKKQQKQQQKQQLQQQEESENEEELMKKKQLKQMRAFRYVLRTDEDNHKIINKRNNALLHQECLLQFKELEFSQYIIAFHHHKLHVNPSTLIDLINKFYNVDFLRQYVEECLSTYIRCNNKNFVTNLYKLEVWQNINKNQILLMQSISQYYQSEISKYLRDIKIETICDNLPMKYKQLILELAYGEKEMQLILKNRPQQQIDQLVDEIFNYQKYQD